MNYLPLFSRATEIRNQHVIKVAPESQRVDCSNWYTSHQVYGCQQHVAVAAEQRNVVFQPVYVMQSPYPQVFNTANKVVPCNGIQAMTVEQTASLIRGLCLHLGWRETKEYVMSFRENNIDGSLLMYLNHEILRFDMGICNHFHRIDLLAVIRQLFPLYLNRGFNEPVRLSDIRNLDTNYSNGSKKATTRMQGSPSANDKPCYLKHPVSEQDDSLGVDQNSQQNISLNSVSTKSDCIMESTEGKSQSSPTSKQLIENVKLESKGISGNCSFSHKNSVEKAAPWKKSFEGVNELRLGKSHDANDSYAVQKESTPGSEVSAKLILTHSNLNLVGIENIRNRFMKFNFCVSIEQASHFYCVLTFRSRVEAMTALTYQHHIGFKLDPYEDGRCRTRMNPVVNQTLSHNTSSSDYSLNRNVKNSFDSIVSMCTKCKAQEICACKLRNHSCASETVGWVSLESEEGQSLLQKHLRCEK